MFAVYTSLKKLCFYSISCERIDGLKTIWILQYIGKTVFRWISAPQQNEKMKQENIQSLLLLFEGTLCAKTNESWWPRDKNDKSTINKSGYILNMVHTMRWESRHSWRIQMKREYFAITGCSYNFFDGGHLRCYNNSIQIYS